VFVCVCVCVIYFLPFVGAWAAALSINEYCNRPTHQHQLQPLRQHESQTERHNSHRNHCPQQRKVRRYKHCDDIEFNLNIPPLLGVIGTIYAFASFIAVEKSVSDVMLVLKENFNSAAMTTILGGITYTINYIILIINEKLINKD